MKKIVFVLLLSLLTACQTHEISGKFFLSSIEINNNVYVEGDEEWETILGMNIPGENIYIDLKNDGDFIYMVGDEKKNGTWNEENSLVTMNINGFEEKATYEDDMLVLVNSQDIKLIFKK